MDSGNSPTHQQFCLRWHNHQTSLLSSLPLLLDQSHLTDVTLSAEGKTLQAHRVVLSACSTFFSELFRTLDSSYHPVIVIPGASFGAVVALLTFMYSGEVNVFEEQIPTLIAVAETLGIKGLADFHNNSSLKDPKTQNTDLHKEPDTNTVSSPKIPSPLQSFFIKSLQFYPNLIPQPLNFSQSALNKTSEFIAKYQHHCNLMQQTAKQNDAAILDEDSSNRSSYMNERKLKEIKKIDKIVENLRSATTSKSYLDAGASKTPIKASHSPTASVVLNQPSFSQLHHVFMPTDEPSKSSDALTADVPHLPAKSYSPENLSSNEFLLEKTISDTATTKATNAKLCATCFICHKQLSNQYNLRVHLETHQNVRYACNVCSHVSRSKDALRKHVSYRHPGAPSPCESETRRKRSKPFNAPFRLIKHETDIPPQLAQISSQQVMCLKPPNESPQSISAPNTPGVATPSDVTNANKEAASSETADSV